MLSRSGRLRRCGCLRNESAQSTYSPTGLVLSGLLHLKKSRGDDDAQTCRKATEKDLRRMVSRSTDHLRSHRSRSMYLSKVAVGRSLNDHTTVQDVSWLAVRSAVGSTDTVKMMLQNSTEPFRPMLSAVKAWASAPKKVPAERCQDALGSWRVRSTHRRRAET